MYTLVNGIIVENNYFIAEKQETNSRLNTQKLDRVAEYQLYIIK